MRKDSSRWGGASPKAPVRYQITWRRDPRTLSLVELFLLSLHSSVVCVSSDSLGVGEPAVEGVFHSTPIRFCPGDDLMKNADRCVRDGQPRSRILRSVGLLLPPRRISLFCAAGSLCHSTRPAKIKVVLEIFYYTSSAAFLIRTI